MENKIELRDYYNKYQKEILLIGGGFIIGMMLGKFVLIMGYSLWGRISWQRCSIGTRKRKRKPKRVNQRGRKYEI